MKNIDLRNVLLSDIEEEIKRRENCMLRPSSNIMLIGPPGVGKTTQALKLCEENCWCYINISTLLREEILGEGPAKDSLWHIVNQKGAVKDANLMPVIERKIKQPMCSKGIVFDGLPRTLSHAILIEKLLNSHKREIDKVIELQAPQDILLERVRGRMVHPSSGRTYHKTFCPSKIEDIDDYTGEGIIDVSQKHFYDKLRSYNLVSRILQQHFKIRKKLFLVNGSRGFNEVLKDLNDVINS